MAANVWAQNYWPRKISNRTFRVIRRQLDKDQMLISQKLKENNLGLLHDVSARSFSQKFTIP